MALLKIVRHARQHGLGAAAQKLFRVLPGYLVSFYLWRIRRCACCHRWTVFLANGPASETRACLFCSANERYELLATEIEQRFSASLCEKDVLELDPHSPLRNRLSFARRYTRSFYAPGVEGGATRADGAVCEDITSLTFEDASLDLIISSDVLEHVPLLEKAFSESARVLRPGGAHLFTVPPRSKTRRRAEIIDGEIRYVQPPEYHRDPLSAEGILAFWDIGPDLPAVISSRLLNLRVACGPVGKEGRIVWIAERCDA